MLSKQNRSVYIIYEEIKHSSQQLFNFKETIIICIDLCSYNMHSCTKNVNISQLTTHRYLVRELVVYIVFWIQARQRISVELIRGTGQKFTSLQSRDIGCLETKALKAPRKPTYPLLCWQSCRPISSSFYTFFILYLLHFICSLFYIFYILYLLHFISSPFYIFFILCFLHSIPSSFYISFILYLFHFISSSFYISFILYRFHFISSPFIFASFYIFFILYLLHFISSLFNI